MKENIFLRLVADTAGVSIEFKDEKILPGTGWLNKLPIDIQFVKGKVILNSVGMFQGDEETFSTGKYRGKGKFKALIPFIKEALIERGFEAALYLVPLSPCWDKYKLVDVHPPIKGCYKKVVL